MSSNKKRVLQKEDFEVHHNKDRDILVVIPDDLEAVFYVKSFEGPLKKKNNFLDAFNESISSLELKSTDIKDQEYIPVSILKEEDIIDSFIPNIEKLENSGEETLYMIRMYAKVEKREYKSSVMHFPNGEILKVQMGV